MNTMNKFLKYTAIICLGLLFVSCDKLFDDLEGDLTRMTQKDMDSTVAG